MSWHFIKGILNIIGGMLVSLTIGTVYLWGNINIYITSYYRLHGNPNLKLTSSNFNILFWFLF